MPTQTTTPNYKKPFYWVIAAATAAALLALGQFFPEGSFGAQVISWVQSVATALGVGAIALPTVGKSTPTLLLLGALGLATLTGCSGLGQTPTRSTVVNQTLKFDSCTVTFGEAPSIAEQTYPRSNQFGVVDVQSTNEGSETTTATPSIANPTTSLTLPATSATGTLDALAKSLVTPSAATTTTPAAAATTDDCVDGSCTTP